MGINQRLVMCVSKLWKHRKLPSKNPELPGSSNIIPAIQSVALEEAVQEGVLLSLQDHMFESSPEDNHVFNLTKCISQCFLKIRMHYLAKERTALIKGENIRKHGKNAKCSWDPELSHFKCSSKCVETMGYFYFARIENTWKRCLLPIEYYCW